MKKILLTTAVAAVALTASASAFEAGKAYLNGGFGYNFSDNLSKITEADDGRMVDSRKSLKGFYGKLGAGYKFTGNFAIEGLLDYNPNKRTKRDDNIAILPLDNHNPHSAFGTNNLIPIWKDGKDLFQEGTINKSFGVAQTESNQFIDFADRKSTSKESNFGFGAKAVFSHALVNKISVNTGIGAGLDFKSLETIISGIVERGTAKQYANFRAKSDTITQPFALLTFGADYAINDSVSAGLEYGVKFSTGEDYKARSNIKQKTITSTGNHNLELANATGASDNVFEKGYIIGKTSKINQSVKATVKFAL
jgi:outer membrane protein W